MRTCWHIPFKRSVSVIKQATNNRDIINDSETNAAVITNGIATHVALAKDGDD